METIMKQAIRRLTRSSRDRVFGGVCGGIAEYLDIDPVLVRVLYVGLTVISFGFGVLFYAVAWIVIPLGFESPYDRERRADSGVSGRKILGVVLIIIGAIIVIATVGPFPLSYHDAQYVMPLLLIAAGIILVVRRGTRTRVERTDVAGGPEDATILDEQVSQPETAAAGETDEPRRMYRRERGRKIAGVCAGLGEYFGVDATIIRLFGFVLTLIPPFFVGVVAYIVLWIVMPLKLERLPGAPGGPQT